MNLVIELIRALIGTSQDALDALREDMTRLRWILFGIIASFLAIVLVINQTKLFELNWVLGLVVVIVALFFLFQPQLILFWLLQKVLISTMLFFANSRAQTQFWSTLKGNLERVAGRKSKLFIAIQAGFFGIILFCVAFGTFQFSGLTGAGITLVTLGLLAHSWLFNADSKLFKRLSFLALILIFSALLLKAISPDTYNMISGATGLGMKYAKGWFGSANKDKDQTDVLSSYTDKAKDISLGRDTAIIVKFNTLRDNKLKEIANQYSEDPVNLVAKSDSINRLYDSLLVVIEKRRSGGGHESRSSATQNNVVSYQLSPNEFELRGPAVIATVHVKKGDKVDVEARSDFWRVNNYASPNGTMIKTSPGEEITITADGTLYLAGGDQPTNVRLTVKHS